MFALEAIGTWPFRLAASQQRNRAFVLAGHVAANAAVGNDRRVLLGTITQLLPFIGYPRPPIAIKFINDVTQA